MAEIVGGLFGVTPEALQMQREKQSQQEALNFAQLQDPFARANYQIYQGASGLGRQISGLLGAQDPEMMRIQQRQSMLQNIDLTNPESLKQGIQTATQNKDYQLANELANKLQTATKAILDTRVQESVISKNMQQKQIADPTQKLLEAGKYTPESVSRFSTSGNMADLQFADKIETKSEFERILGSLNLSPDQEKQVKQQWVQAKLNPDSNGLKGLQAQLLQAQVDQKQLKLEADREKTATEKTQAVSKLSSTESGLDTALNTAEKALKLAPNSLAGGMTQAVSASIPWTDAKALNNLVSSLNSDKAIGTLEELKSQSRTGATGFGALSEKELTLILNKTRALDPTDKLFKENLSVVMEGWNKIRNQVRESRLNLQGKKTEANAEAMINKTIEYNKSKGNMIREQAVQLLKSAGRLPADY
jgi:hypothetical protein